MASTFPINYSILVMRVTVQYIFEQMAIPRSQSGMNLECVVVNTKGVVKSRGQNDQWQ
jgi:hypothetical protein